MGISEAVQLVPELPIKTDVELTVTLDVASPTFTLLEIGAVVYNSEKLFWTLIMAVLSESPVLSLGNVPVLIFC